MSTVMEKLEELKTIIHPEKTMNIIDQCAIVAEGLSPGSPYEDDIEGLSIFLELSYNQVYKMKYVHHNLIPELKDWIRGTEYRCHTTYDFATKSKEEQEHFMDVERTIERGV